MWLTDRCCCAFCCAFLGPEYYSPIRSKRGMKVYACHRCGLVQSISTTPYVSRPPGNLSSDADRSSYRYTKTLAHPGYTSFLDEIDWPSNPAILDVGSNRGVFADSILKLVSGAKVVCVEPDPFMESEVYARDDVFLLRRRFEEISLEEDSFDLIFCAHTLEHAFSAPAMLREFHKLLRPNGKLFIAVPNTILYGDVVEELFIDPHTFHFTYEVLVHLARATGFQVSLSSDPGDHEIRLLLEKVNGVDDLPEVSGSSVFNLKQYSLTLGTNRRRLRDMCRRLEQGIGDGKLVVWGAGRLLDALLVGGTLNTDRILGVVDSHLHRLTPSLRGLQVTSPDAIPLEWLEARLFVASRDYSEEIKLQAEQIGFREIETFVDLWRESDSVSRNGK